MRRRFAALSRYSWASGYYLTSTSYVRFSIQKKKKFILSPNYTECDEDNDDLTTQRWWLGSNETESSQTIFDRRFPTWLITKTDYSFDDPRLSRNPLGPWGQGSSPSRHLYPSHHSTPPGIAAPAASVFPRTNPKQYGSPNYLFIQKYPTIVTLWTYQLTTPSSKIELKIQIPTY